MKSIIFCICLFICQIGYAQVGKDTGVWEFNLEQHEAVISFYTNETAGTGFIFHITDQKIGDDFIGYALTACHVCGECGKLLSARYISGRAFDNCSVVASNTELDVAVVKVLVPAGIKAIKIAESEPKKDESVEIVGYGGVHPLHSVIMQRRYKGPVTGPNLNGIMFINQTAIPGDSGGLIMNDKGECVGVVSGGWFWYDVISNRTTDSGVFDEKKLGGTWPIRSADLNAIKLITEPYIK